MSENFKLQDINDLTFGQHFQLFKELQEDAEKNPEKAVSLLPDFYNLLEGKGSTPDMLPTAADVFAIISKNLSQAQISEALKTLHQLDKDRLIERGTKIICKRNPVCAKPIFDYIAAQVDSTPYCDDNKNFLLPAARNMTTALSYAADKETSSIIKKINSFAPEVQDLFVSSYGKLYVQKPSFREVFLGKILKDASEPCKFGRLYQNLGDIIIADAEKIPQCLSVISAHISDTRQDSSDLNKVYEVLGQIRRIPVYTKKADVLLMRGLQNPKNSKHSKKTGYRQLEKFDELTSRSSIGQRVEKTDHNPHGFKHVDDITTDEPAILVLGGNGADSDRRVNGYLSSLEKLLERHKIQEKVSLYAAIYDFGEMDDKAVTFNDHLARTKMMQDRHRRVELKEQLNEDTLHPRYVEDLFNKAFLRRISDKSGNRLPIEEACAKMRKLTVVAHCHGAYTFLKLEEKMQQKMQELGYTAQEQTKILHEVLCVAHAPYAPLGTSKATMISFVSAQDFDITHYNNFETEIRNMSRNKEVLLSYFPGKQGEMFLTPSMGEDMEQHNFLGYDTTQKGLSKEGQAILGLSANAIVNGVKNSLDGKLLPGVKELVSGKDEKVQKFFDRLQENGAKMWQKISENTAARLKAEYGKAR